MRNYVVLAIGLLCLVACSGTIHLANKAMRKGLVGQDQTTVEARLGLPVKEICFTNGEKVLVYEYYDRVYEPPREIKAHSFQLDENGHRNGFDPFDLFVYLNYDSSEADFDIYTHFLEVYFDDQGHCVAVEHNLSKEQLKVMLQQFSNY